MEQAQPLPLVAGIVQHDMLPEALRHIGPPAEAGDGGGHFQPSILKE